jgi:hypothetical protein
VAAHLRARGLGLFPASYRGTLRQAHVSAANHALPIVAPLRLDTRHPAPQ